MRFAVLTVARVSLLALVVALSACGGDDDQDAAETTVETSPQPPPTVLKLGDSREAVAELQQLLRDRGYDVPVNDKFDEQTENAVRAFQTDVGLPADGVVNAATIEALRNPNSLSGGTTSPTTSVASTTTTTRPRPGPTRETIPSPEPPIVDSTPDATE
ncbi:MAG: peptidoglycan-binding domain-containing protein [Acidimicrobiia bacterium]